MSVLGDDEAGRCLRVGSPWRCRPRNRGCPRHAVFSLKCQQLQREFLHKLNDATKGNLGLMQWLLGRKMQRRHLCVNRAFGSRLGLVTQNVHLHLGQTLRRHVGVFSVCSPLCFHEPCGEPPEWKTTGPRGREANNSSGVGDLDPTHDSGITHTVLLTSAAWIPVYSQPLARAMAIKRLIEQNRTLCPSYSK